ncbi:MAG: preprotein translocase subunit SecE [Patescibacteria group bacterium]|jgi:preprotein translocase subunit SecE
MASKLIENRLVAYLLEAKEELKKVTWPSKKDLIRYSVAVILFCLIIATYFGVLDWALNLGMKYLLSLVA